MVFPGMFELRGSTHELTNIDPVCKVYHDCDDGIKPGKRKIKFKIPSQYISDSANPSRIYDIGEINLEVSLLHHDKQVLTTSLDQVSERRTWTLLTPPSLCASSNSKRL